MIPRVRAVAGLAMLTVLSIATGFGVKSADASHSLNHALYDAYPPVWVFGTHESVWRAKWTDWDNASDIGTLINNPETYNSCEYNLALYDVNEGATGRAGYTIFDCYSWNSSLQRYDIYQAQAYVNTYYSLTSTQVE